jgi:hypothetical protein
VKDQRSQSGWLRVPVSTPLLGIPVGMDVYLNNGYRVLGLPANASPDLLAKESGRLKAVTKLSPAAVRRLWVRNGYEDQLSPEEAISAAGRLKEPRYRLVCELFWPHLLNGTSEMMAAGRSLEDERMLRSLERAAGQEPGRASVLAKHALAVLYHNLALRDELKSFAGESTWNKHYWERSLAMWSQTLGSSHFWDYLADRVRGFDDPRVRPEDLGEVRDALWKVVLEFNSVLARSHAEKHPELANGHMLLIANAECPAEALTAVLGNCVKSIVVKRLSPVTTKAQAELTGLKSNIRWEEFERRCEPILQAAFGVQKFLSEELRLADDLASMAEFDGLCDLIYTGLNQSIDYTHDRERALLYAMVTLRRCLRLPLSSAGRLKLESAIRQDSKILYRDMGLPETYDPTECWFLTGELADPRACLLRPVYKITKLTPVNIAWNARQILIPRSSLAEGLHRGRVPASALEGRASRPEAAQITAEMNAARAEAQRETSGLEKQLAEVHAKVRQKYVSRIQKAEAAIPQAEHQAAQRAAAVERERDQAIGAERARCEAECQRVRAAHQDGIRQTEQDLQALRQGKTSGGSSSVKTAITLGLAGAAVGALAAYLLDFWFLLPERLAGAHGLVLGACLGSALGTAGTGFAGRRRVGKAERHLRHLNALLEQDLKATEAKRDTAIRGLKDRAAATLAEVRRPVQERQDQLHKLQKELDTEVARETKSLDSRITAVRRETEEKVRQLESKLAGLLKPRSESSVVDFPACKRLKSDGYVDGTEPSDSQAQSMMSREMERFVHSLTDHERLMLQVLMRQAGSGREGDVIRQFIEIRGR